MKLVLAATALLAAQTAAAAVPAKALRTPPVTSAARLQAEAVDHTRAGVWYRHAAAQGMSHLAGRSYLGTLDEPLLGADTVRLFFEDRHDGKLQAQVQLSGEGFEGAESIIAVRTLPFVDVKAESRSIRAEGPEALGVVVELTMDGLGRLRGTLALRAGRETGWVEVPVLLQRSADVVACAKPCRGAVCDLSAGECVDAGHLDGDVPCPGDMTCPADAN